MKTGMLIINYNDFSSTSDLIKQVRSYKVIDKIVVVDNHSTDDSVKKLKKFCDAKVEVLVADKNLGYSGAINFGSRYLIDKFKECNIIVSNPDILLYKEDDIKELLSLLKKKDVGVVGPTILEQGMLNRGWRNPTPLLDSLMNLPYIHRFIRKQFIKYKESHYSGDTSKVEVLSGCFFCITSKVLEKINFLDEKVFLYYEENILAKKLENIGLSCLIDNRVLIVHNHSVTIDRNLNKIKKYQAQKKSQYYFQVTYQKANVFERALLKSTRFISEKILTVYYYLKDLKK